MSIADKLNKIHPLKFAAMRLRAESKNFAEEADMWSDKAEAEAAWSRLRDAALEFATEWDKCERTQRTKESKP